MYGDTTSADDAADDVALGQKGEKKGADN